ncbi:uncharacterized protein N7483_002388 [Penicillium malachiteum]|uniref:uncharacterized protein n=1 Tax=Penicillium malachiteum TaxID=1324776 RepID=UPI002547D055|nr:uncharacterized protein N7483_002388 [Penicillium malachiteum]KAJ5737263.1 hypothetical protein N7483_002388 [Penicillium malachiteum]
MISDIEDPDSDAIDFSKPQLFGALDQGRLQSVPQNLILDGSNAISTSTASSECHCMNSTQAFRDNRARFQSERHLFDNKQLQLLSHEDFSALSSSNQQEYFHEISGALNNWQAFGNLCPRIDEFILRHCDT